MKHSHRSAIALITSGLLAGGALGAAALARQHNGGDSAAQVASVSTNTGSDMSAAIQDILAQSAAMHDRMLASRADLANINRQLKERRAMARAAALATSVVAQATLSPNAGSADDSTDTTGSAGSGTDSSETDSPDNDDPTTSTPTTTRGDDDTTGSTEHSPRGGDPTGGGDDDNGNDDNGNDDNGGTGHPDE